MYPSGAITAWQDFTPVVSATGTDPTLGTVTLNRGRWRFVGLCLELRWDYDQTGGGADGLGDYRISLPPLPAGVTVDLDDNDLGVATKRAVGSGIIQASAAADTQGTVFYEPGAGLLGMQMSAGNDEWDDGTQGDFEGRCHISLFALLPLTR